MFPLVEIPDIVQHYAPFFASVFSPEALQQFQRYVSGLIVSEALVGFQGLILTCGFETLT